MKVEVAGVKPSPMRRAAASGRFARAVASNVQAGTPVAVDDGAVFGAMEGPLPATQARLLWMTLIRCWRITPRRGARTALTLSMLEDLVAERGGHIFAFHRSIGETEDPFGTDALDQRWEERYDRHAPPTVVFNGSTYVIGSVPEGDSLLDDYRALANQSLDLPEGGTSVFGRPHKAAAPRSHGRSTSPSARLERSPRSFGSLGG